MVQSYKIDVVKEIKARITDAKAIVLVDYKGINIDEVNELRARMREAGVEYFVQKNTLIKIALNELGITELDSYLINSTAVAVSLKDEVAPAKVIAKFKKEVMEDKEFPSFKVGYVGGVVFDEKQLRKLASMPSRDELIAQVLSCFNGPIQGLVVVLSRIIKKFVYAVDAIAKQKAE
ncbi:MAG: 50S ribosomal protein L10 [Candidatus Zophobacter franzmannii]|nr:50S ribosomal protein L10 [Candidatus Zophobacter franzmannii]